MKYAAERDAKDAHIKTLYFAILVLLTGCLGLWYGWQKSPENLRITIPPDLRHGAVVKPGEYIAATIEAFAKSTFRELHRWEEDGAVDYGRKLFHLQAYLTPRYRQWLLDDIENKAAAGELNGRERYTLEIGDTTYDEDNVQSIDDGSWLVHVRLIIVERVDRVEVKRVGVHYPLRVLKMNISPTKNVWGLAIDGYPVGMQESIIEGAVSERDS